MYHATIDAALPLDEVSLHHTIQLPPAQARRFADRAGSHGVESWRLRQLIRAIDKLIPPMGYGKFNGQDNPNNGHPHHWYTIGKEYSRVLYVSIAKAYLDSKPPFNRPVFDYGRLTSQLDLLAREFRADEHNTTENDDAGYTFRFWWD